MQSTGPTTGGQKIWLKWSIWFSREQKKPLPATAPPHAMNSCLNIPDCFRSSANKEAYKIVSRLLTMKVHNEFSEILTAFACFKGKFKTWVREGSCPCQAPTRRVVFALPRTTTTETGQTTKAANYSTPKGASSSFCLHPCYWVSLTA